MQKQKLVNTQDERTLDILDDVNIDEKTLEFLTETFGESEASEESKKQVTPEEEETAVDSDTILTQDVITRNQLGPILKLRKYVHRQIINSERASAMCIRNLILCKELFEKDLGSSDPLLEKEEINDLFYKLDDIKSLVDDLSGRLEGAFVNWSAGVQLFPAYQAVLDQMGLLAAYEKNLARAREVIAKKGGPGVFDEIIKGEIPIIDKSFEDLLISPVRLKKRLTYGINEILKYTPEDHPDYDDMKRALLGLSHVLDSTESEETQANYILKSGYIVQLKENVRKLRYLFLFPTCLIITRPHISYGSVWYAIKDIILLESLTWLVTDNPVDQRNDASKDAKKNLAQTKSDLETFLRNTDSKQTIFKKWKIQRLKQRMYKNEAKMMLFTPAIKLTLHDAKTNNQFIFFFTSHFDVDDWIEILDNLKRNATGKTHTEDVYRNSIKDFRLLPRLTAFKPEAAVNRYLNGTLDVYIHQVKGLDKLQNSYLTIQADCFGGFFMTVYSTRVCNDIKEPLFNQKIEVLLDSSHLLKVCLYTSSKDDNKSLLCGKAIFDLEAASLHSGYRLVTLPLYPNQSIVVAISLRYAFHQVGYKRKYSVIPSNSLERVKNMRGRVFEEQLKIVTNREKRLIPIVVSSCVEAINNRGLNKENIYSVDGNAEQVEELMALFDLCSLTGAQYVKDEKYDAATIATLLKNYLQKLPSSLLPEPTKYMAAFDGTDKQVKMNKILLLIRLIPDPEYTLFCYMIDHLISLSKNESQTKMGVQALAAAVGPCFLGMKGKAESEESIKENEKFKLIVEFIMRMKMNGTDLGKQN